MWVLAWTPAFFSYLLADLLVPVLVLVTLHRERRIGPLGRGMFRNLRIAFREEWTPELSRRLLWGWARHMTHTAVDFARMVRMTPENVARYVELDGIEQLRALHAEGRGVICASGHLGIWELCGHVVALCGLPALAVSRPADNQAVVDVLTRIRVSGGQRITEKWGVLWPLRKALSRGEIIGLAADENAEDNPIFAPFLGTLAATHGTPALLASRTGAPIAVISCNRIGRGRFRFHLWDVIRTERTTTRDADLEGVTTRISAALSRAILAYPEQWLWGVRRFSTRPTGEVPGQDGLPPPAAAQENTLKTAVAEAR
jgi:KDO2-lipid IV(A) lauroyltransferase